MEGLDLSQIFVEPPVKRSNLLLFLFSSKLKCWWYERGINDGNWTRRSTYMLFS